MRFPGYVPSVEMCPLCWTVSHAMALSQLPPPLFQLFFSESCSGKANLRKGVDLFKFGPVVLKLLQVFEVQIHFSKNSYTFSYFY